MSFLPITFDVFGHPEHQGNHVPAYGGRGVRDKNEKKLRPWRNAIHLAAQHAMGDTPLLSDGVALHLTFMLARPKGHYRSNGHLKPTAPVWKITRPDMDKLERAVLDGLTGAVYHDDSQVVAKRTFKTYIIDPLQEGVRITVQDMRAPSEDSWLRPA